MSNAADYLIHIKALLVAHSRVKKWSVVREEAQGSIGIFRYRVTLRNDSLLEMFERFHISEGQVFVSNGSRLPRRL